MNNGLRRWIEGYQIGKGEASYFAAFNTANVLNYAFLIALAPLLGTESFGLFAALFGLIYLASALGNAVQIAVARQIAHSRAPAGGDLSHHDLLRLSLPAGLLATVLFLAFIVASPVLFEDASATTIAWAAVAAGLAVIVPATYGVLQGRKRFGLLGLSYFIAAAVRIEVAVGLIAVGAGPAGALAGVAIGYVASGVFAALFCASDEGTDNDVVLAKAPSLDSLAAALVVSLAVAVPTSLDVVLARHFFSDTEAGVYATIAVLGRAVIFVSLAISLIALPKVASKAARDEDSSHLLWSSLCQTAIVGGGTAALVGFVVAGLGWSPIGELTAATGALYWYLAATLACVLVVSCLYYQIGRGKLSNTLMVLIPGALAQGLAVVLFHGSLTETARALFAVNAALLLASVLQALLAASSPQSERMTRLARSLPIVREWASK